MELVINIIIIILDVVENLFPLSRHIGKTNAYLLSWVNTFQVPFVKTNSMIPWELHINGEN